MQLVWMFSERVVYASKFAKDQCRITRLSNSMVCGAKVVYSDGSGLGGGAVRDVVALEKMQQMNFAPGHADELQWAF